jgi:hypothetical protein
MYHFWEKGKMDIKFLLEHLKEWTTWESCLKQTLDKGGVRMQTVLD